MRVVFLRWRGARHRPSRSAVATGVLAGAAAAVAVIALGQDASAQVRRFETYDQAIEALAPLGACPSFEATDLTFTIADAAVTLFDDLTMLGIAGQGRVPFGAVGAIGQSLSARCFDFEFGNGTTGSALAGAFASTFSTRTVSQFTFSQRRPGDGATPATDAAGSASYTLGGDLEAWLFPAEAAPVVAAGGVAAIGALTPTEALPTGELRVVDDRLSVFANFTYESVTQVQTEFESRVELDTFTGSAGVAYRVSPGFVLGVSGFVSRSDGQSDIGNDAVAQAVNEEAFTGALVPVGPILFEDLCGVSSEGDIEQDEFGGSVFGVARVGAAGFIQGEVGASRFDQTQERPVCDSSFSESVMGPSNAVLPGGETLVYSGVLESEPTGRRVQGSLRSGYDWTVAGLFFGPRVGLDVANVRVDAYQESEVAAPAEGALVVGGQTFNLQGRVPSGLALAYEEQAFTSVQSRLGAIVAYPVRTERVAFTPFFEGTYIHEFGNDQRDVEVSFVEDGRAEPLVFSFKTNAPDRDFFEVKGGLNLQVGERVEASLGGSTLLGNDLIDSVSAEAAIRVNF